MVLLPIVLSQSIELGEGERCGAANRDYCFTYKVCPATRAFFQLLQNAEPATKVLFAIQAKINQISFAPFSNPSQECYYNSINPLVKGLPNIFTDLYMGGPTYSQAQNIQGPPVSALPLSPQFNSLNYIITVYSYNGL